ncbi:SIT4 phosphatase-associated protein-domain-containing protein [Achaetomium macrosporum]|uniref:SIT4 phosphatase-associated protein-domain-containing protein n=1 Tax=Achaetomium macrosporum TaxID=79813 RepID=A0AAN7CB88_9PEZI|nr:SIT4 phosphatase-associated protein-domain-containing protein [Achaetomium macrosporum]
MFWRFGGYGNVSTIDSILERDNFQLEELLDDGELVQELKSHNAKLVEYLRGPEVLEKLLRYVVAPKLEPVAAPDDEEEEDSDEKAKGIALPFTRSRSSSGARTTNQEDSEKKRNRYAFIATEILSSETWSMYEALMESKPLLRNFWQFLKRETPLDPLQASYFTKVNESLFDKKTEEMVDLLKSMDGAVSDILRHVDCPMIMDLLLKIISLERTESGQGIVEWLYTQDVMPTLISFLGPEHSWATQTSAADFIKAIITVSANASQNEQTCIGPNELTRQLVSRPCVEQLIKYMLGGGNPLTCGVGIVIEVIRKNNSDYDPEGVDINAPPSSRDPIYLGTLLRLFAEHVPDFMNLILNAPAQKQQLSSTFGDRIEPLGFDRFKTCELMAELLHCSNMMLLNEVGAEDLIAARDAQRQRLRAEGRLLPVSTQEPMSTEDASMQASRFSVADEGRKLEVMNVSADDDGFEELSPTSSLIDKVEANFPDEALSSPKLSAEAEANGSEQQPPFEDIDLMVAPLSPNKKAAQMTEDNEANKGTAAGESTEGNESQEGRSDDPAREQTQLEPESQQAGDSAAASAIPERREGETDESSNPKPAESNPADTPSTQVRATQIPEISAQASIANPGPPHPGDSNAESAEQTGGAPAVGPTAEAPNPEADAPNKAKPVVGDYLKMQFVEHRVVPTILSFFFKYPWNNFLHNVVYDIVQQVFNGPMDRGYNPTLAISLFEAADITNQIINGQRASEKSQAESKTRMGYMGHLTLIAEEVVKFTERHPPELVSELVLEKVMAQGWVDYVEGALAETRERDNAILGGVRPEVAMSNRANAQSLMGAGFAGLSSIGLGAVTSSALADAGLSGGSDVAEGSGGGGAGPFAISAGTLMGGFGSSSDEDDEEEHETEEDVNNEFRAYTDPLNANSNSMNPPSIPPPPPPPPPLNIPPSRARLQLAARLAMNKRNAAAAAAAANGGEEGNSSTTAVDTAGPAAFTLPSATSSERIRNPFADYDDDDEENSGSGSDDGENVEGDDLGMNTGSSSWNRGSWWRGMVRSARGREHRRTVSDDMEQEVEVERFGDGRDDDSSDEDGGRRIRDDDIEDEEFGDFAMPEVEERVGGGGGLVSGIDPDRESVLVKPMPLHPTTTTLKSTVSPFSSLWPFSREKREDDATPAEGAASSAPAITEEPVELTTEEETVLGEDGKKIDRAVEATRRTSIEDPDEDEVDIGEEIIVHRATGAR